MIPLKINKYILLTTVILLIVSITVSFRYYPVNIINRLMDVNFSIISTKVISWVDNIKIHGGIAYGIFRVSKRDFDANIKYCNKRSNISNNNAKSINGNFGEQQDLGHIECTLYRSRIKSEQEYLLFIKSDEDFLYVKYIAIVN